MPSISWNDLNTFVHKVRSKLQLSVKVELRAKKMLQNSESEWIKKLAKEIIMDSRKCRQAIAEELQEINDIILKQTEIDEKDEIII